jgi:hypothetical protein
LQQEAVSLFQAGSEREMAKKPQVPAEVAKTQRLRELRQADEAERRSRGVWGTASVGEIQHAASKSAFVLCYRGREAPDPAKQVQIRSSLVSSADQNALIEWLGRWPLAEFNSRIVAWSLSNAEAKRIRVARIEEMRAVGTDIVNAADTAVVAPAVAPIAARLLTGVAGEFTAR